MVSAEKAIVLGDGPHVGRIGGGAGRTFRPGSVEPAAQNLACIFASKALMRMLLAMEGCAEMLAVYWKWQHW